MFSIWQLLPEVIRQPFFILFTFERAYCMELEVNRFVRRRARFSFFFYREEKVIFQVDGLFPHGISFHLSALHISTPTRLHCSASLCQRQLANMIKFCSLIFGEWKCCLLVNYIYDAFFESFVLLATAPFFPPSIRTCVCLPICSGSERLQQLKSKHQHLPRIHALTRFKR